MSPEVIRQLLNSWRDAERARDGGPQGGGAYVEANEAVERARQAYLDAVRTRAARHGYAGGQRPIQADIEHLADAERRRRQSEPSTPGYHRAAKDIEDRALRILTQVVEDEVAAERAMQSSESEPTQLQ